MAPLLAGISLKRVYDHYSPTVAMQPSEIHTHPPKFSSLLVSISDSHRNAWGHTLKLHVALMLALSRWALNLWHKIHPHPRTHSQCNILVVNRFTFPRFPKYPFINQPKREGKELGGLCNECLAQDSISVPWIRS